MKHILGYVRVSTEEQAIHGLSIEAQTAALEEWVQSHDCKLAGIYTDAGISARKPATKRPELQRLLTDVKAGKGDLIIFTKLDRWFRNIAEYYKVQEVLEKHHVDWKTIHEDYDTSTASGRLKINIMLSVAQDEADRTSERIKAVFHTKREKREPLGGNCPTGYKVDGKKLIKDPAKEAAVTAFFQKFLACGSVSAAQKHVLDNYGLRIEYQLASKMLDSPAYYGRYYGTDGMTPPYITKEEFARIQELRIRPVRKTKYNRTYLFSGIAVCGECGYHLGPKTNTRNKVPMYNCPAHYIKRSGCENKTNISERKIEAYLLDMLEEKVRDYRIEYLRIMESKRDTDYKSEISAIRSKLNKLKDLYLNDYITLDEYRADHMRLSARLEKLMELDRPKKKHNNLDRIDELVCSGWREAYDDLSQADRREFWQALVKAIRIYPDRHIEYDLLD